MQGFEKITGQNIKKRLAIVLDNKVNSAPVIQDKISGGRAQITGRFNMDEAKDLAIVLRAGALPAPVKIIEERTVGPSLGKDSIEKGFRSMLIGGVVVILFMIIYYSPSSKHSFYYGRAGLLRCHANPSRDCRDYSYHWYGR